MSDKINSHIYLMLSVYLKWSNNYGWQRNHMLQYIIYIYIYYIYYITEREI